MGRAGLLQCWHAAAVSGAMLCSSPLWLGSCSTAPAGIECRGIGASRGWSPSWRWPPPAGTVVDRLPQAPRRPGWRSQARRSRGAGPVADVEAGGGASSDACHTGGSTFVRWVWSCHLGHSTLAMTWQASTAPTHSEAAADSSGVGSAAGAESPALSTSQESSSQTGNVP